MNGKLLTVVVILLFLAGVTYLVVKNWDAITGVFGKGGLKECKDLSAFECVKKHGAKKTVANAGDRYDYPNSDAGSYGFYSNNRAVLIGTEKKGSYDKKEIKWDNGETTKLKEIFKK